LGGCPVFPSDNIWNTPVDNLPLDPHSVLYIQSIGRDQTLHPDFGSDPKSGIPFNVVSGNQTLTTIKAASSESDTAPVPVPANPLVEGGGDGHLLIVDQDACRLYELYAAKPLPGGGWSADSAAHFNLRTNQLRPDSWTSADAAGLPIFPGLVRYEEVAAGEIRHALRFSAPKTQRAYVWPARHYASRDTSSALPPMGTRLRLRADFDISGFSKDTQVILRALKKYGMILADNGSPWFISGAPDPHWDSDGMATEMRRIAGSNFEAVADTSLMISDATATAIQPAEPSSGAPTPMIGRCPVLPADNIWNTRVDNLPADSHSALYIRSMLPERPLHADFGRDMKSGIPFNVVSNHAPKQMVQVSPDESDIGPVPTPPNAVLEQGGQADSHLLVIDQDTCRLYELYNAHPIQGGGWKADSAAYFDLRSNALRPEVWTSADAAGLPIFPGLVRYQEVEAGAIHHALRFTTPKTQRAYIWPARHQASRDSNPALPPMGLRVRLKASVDISGFSKPAQVLLRALKEYGMFVADNGGEWFLSGAPDPQWDEDGLLQEIRKIKGADFEVVDETSLMHGPDTAAVIPPAPAGAAPPPGAPSIGNCPAFPSDNFWNMPVDTLPLDSRSSLYVHNMGPEKSLHPDFANSPNSGIPYNLVSGSAAKVPLRVPPAESDTGPVPIPARPLLEGGGAGDSHLLIVDQGACRLYELYAARPMPGGGWSADSAAYYDLRSDSLRPDGWTSADAAGLPIFPGLVRYEEVAAGEIRHALRFSTPKTQRAYIWPARHYASRDSDPALPPMGLRLRLRADFDISGFSKEAQVILRAMKKYGIVLSDNGGAWFFSGAPSPNWKIDPLVEEMRKVTGANFEVVDSSALMRGPNSGSSALPPRQ